MPYSKWVRGGLTAVLGLMLLLASVTATGSYQLPWWSIDGSSNISSSESYAVAGTVGQPEAGTMDSSRFKLIGGFWVQSQDSLPPPPTYQLYLPLIRKE